MRMPGSPVPSLVQERLVRRLLAPATPSLSRAEASTSTRPPAPASTRRPAASGASVRETSISSPTSPGV